jgi:phage terminase large subunit GpA-like protein
MKAAHCAIDTGGHYTSEGYDYCRRHAKDGVVAIKGSSQRNAPQLGKGTKQDVTYRGKTVKNGVTLYMVGTHAIKRTVYSRLKIDEPGAGYIHFDNATTDDYLQGLTCERLQPRYVKGFQVLEWVKPSGARNEPLDLKVYCLAMLELIKRRYNRSTMWDQLAAQIVSSVGSKEPAPRRSRSFKVI